MFVYCPVVHVLAILVNHVVSTFCRLSVCLFVGLSLTGDIFFTYILEEFLPQAHIQWHPLFPDAQSSDNLFNHLSALFSNQEYYFYY